MTDIHDTADLVSKALRRAWQLGQTYWQQADSEYQSHWKKADATQNEFDRLEEDTRAAILTANSIAQPAPSAPEFCPCCGNIMRACMICPNEDCNAVTATAEQAKYNKQHAFARKASGAATPETKS